MWLEFVEQYMYQYIYIFFACIIHIYIYYTCIPLDPINVFLMLLVTGQDY